MRGLVLGAGVLVVAAVAFAGCGEQFEAAPTPSPILTGGGGSGLVGGGGSGLVGGGGDGGVGAVGGSGGDAGQGGAPGECSTQADCETLLGTAPCGAWTCDAGTCRADSPGCTDDDADGFGVGPSCQCAGIDCDDQDDLLGANGQRACYSGPDGTADIGVCHAGVETCTDGVLGPCMGELGPSGEACNGEDDDCNGFVDDGLPDVSCGIGACEATAASCVDGHLAACTPTVAGLETATCNGIDDDCDGAVDELCVADCVRVTPTGDDSTADGSPMNPFASVQAAIDYAAANSRSAVCVAGGQSCSDIHTYQSAVGETVTMADGVSVFGSYASMGWTKCNAGPNGLSPVTTKIQPGVEAGLVFPAAVTSSTALEGFAVDRWADTTTTTTAAITVDGATGAVISHVKIENRPAVVRSYGINLINGAEALITDVWVTGGQATLESIAVRSVGSKPTLLDVCNTLDNQGHCTAGCNGGAGLTSGVEASTVAEAYGIVLDSSPGALVEQVAICGSNGVDGATIKVVGDATGTVIRGSLLNQWGGVTHSHGIWLEDCADAAPWIVDNFRIVGEGSHAATLADGVHSIGTCHPVIDSNVLVAGGSEGNTARPNGIYCGANASQQASRCAVLGNLQIQGSTYGVPPKSVGIRCDAGACVRIADNHLITGRQGNDATGILLGATGTLVERNRIEGGCALASTGLRAEDSWARVENNVIGGDLCSDSGVATTVTQAVSALVAATANHVDVHSNTLLAGGRASLTCVSIALAIESTGSPTSGHGLFRNNILHAGLCGGSRFGVREIDVDADPAIFEHNNIDPTSAAIPTALYDDEVGTLLNLTTDIDALQDMVVAGTLSVPSLFVAYGSDVHLQATSQCIGAGTPTGAPAFDFEGDARDATTPDIGADEAVP